MKFRRYWQDGVRQGGTMDIEAMNKNLLDVKSILDKYEVTFALMGGGLLGVIREGKLLSHDYDLDIACFAGTDKHDHWKMREVKKELESLNFNTVDNSCCRIKTDFFIRNKERIDIFWFEKIDEEWIYNNTLRYPAYFFDKLDEVDFLNTKFKVPSNPKKFLEYTYGKGWTVKKTENYLRSLNPKEVKKRNEK